MIITLNKFGRVLTSRSDGKEAYAAFLPALSGVGKNEAVTIDFVSMLVFSPGWGDEFLTPLLERFGDRLTLRHAKNLSVALTLETLEEVHGYKFRIA